jgi:acyl-CoA reductase-like NAD-dependent aldehyde dehydrogenase
MILDIIQSKTFDNETICASEQALLVDQSIKEQTISELKQQGAYFLNDEKKQKVASILDHSICSILNVWHMESARCQNKRQA